MFAVVLASPILLSWSPQWVVALLIALLVGLLLYRSQWMTLPRWRQAITVLLVALVLFGSTVQAQAPANPQPSPTPNADVFINCDWDFILDVCGGYYACAYYYWFAGGC